VLWLKPVTEKPRYYSTFFGNFVDQIRPRVYDGLRPDFLLSATFRDVADDFSQFRNARGLESPIAGFRGVRVVRHDQARDFWVGEEAMEGQDSVAISQSGLIPE